MKLIVRKQAYRDILKICKERSVKPADLIEELLSGYKKPRKKRTTKPPTEE